MPYVLNLITTSDDYTAANTLVCGSSDVVRLNLKVFNAGIYLALSTTPGLIQGGQQGNEVFYPPGLYTLNRGFSAAAVRSAAVGVPATVAMDAWRVGELT